MAPAPPQPRGQVGCPALRCICCQLCGSGCIAPLAPPADDVDVFLLYRTVFLSRTVGSVRSGSLFPCDTPMCVSCPGPLCQPGALTTHTLSPDQACGLFRDHGGCTRPVHSGAGPGAAAVCVLTQRCFPAEPECACCPGRVTLGLQVPVVLDSVHLIGTLQMLSF